MARSSSNKKHKAAAKPAGQKASQFSSKSASIATSPASTISRRKRREERKQASLPSGADKDSSDDEKQKTTPGSPPKELFVGLAETNKTQGTELTVATIVSKKLFPHIKFICDPAVELLFSRSPKSICGVMLAHCTPPTGVTEEVWWKTARKWIGKQVSVLRSSKNTQMKWSFMRK